MKVNMIKRVRVRAGTARLDLKSGERDVPADVGKQLIKDGYATHVVAPVDPEQVEAERLASLQQTAKDLKIAGIHEDGRGRTEARAKG